MNTPAAEAWPDDDDHHRVDIVVGHLIHEKQFLKATGLAWSGLLKYEELRYVKPAVIKDAIRYYTREQLALIERMQSLVDGTRCLRDAYALAKEMTAGLEQGGGVTAAAA